MRLHWLGGLLVALAGCSSSGGGDSLFDGGSPDGAKTTDGAPGAGIFGRLVDEQDAPLAGVALTLEANDGTALATTVETAVDGSFRIDFADDDDLDDAVLRVERDGHPAARQNLALPAGAQLELLIRLDRGGQLEIEPLLEAPARAPEAELLGRKVRVVALAADGTSAPFRVGLRGAFAADQIEVRLVLRPQSDDWRFASAGSGRSDAVGLPLALGDAAGELHGSIVEVRAVAAPAGSLAGVVDFARPKDLPKPAVFSPDPLTILLAGPQDEAVSAGRIGPRAVICTKDSDGEAWLSPANLRRLGFADGEEVRLRQGRREATVELHADDDPLLSAVTMVLGEREANRLELGRDRRAAGYELEVTPSR